MSRVKIKNLKVLGETEKAYRIKQDRDEAQWIPKSQCEYIFKHPDTKPQIIDIEIPAWLSKKLNLYEED